jgi:hypothetical protein
MADSVSHGREMAAANSAEYLWVCRGTKPPLLPDTKPTVAARSDGSGPEVFESIARKDATQLQLRQRIRPK